MIDKIEIDLAISSHVVWRTKLKQLLIAGERDADVDSIRRDDCCTFGKWLNSLEADEQTDAHVKKVRTLHAAFHLAAGEVAELAAARDVDSAEAMLSPTGKYTAASESLLLALEDWRAGLV